MTNKDYQKLLQRVKKFLGRIKSLLSFDTTSIVEKTMPPTILLCRLNVFTELLPNNDTRIHRQTHRLYFDKTRTAKKLTRPTIPLQRELVAAGT
jgi:hypothetical protein